MAQIEDPAALARLAPDARLITQIMIHAGLRVSDACGLERDCVRRDPAGAAYLHYRNHKMNRDATVPISEDLAAAVQAQAVAAQTRFAHGKYLIPQVSANQSGTKPYQTGGYREAFNRWLEKCDFRESNGDQAHVTPHRFRHTYGTRLINAGVPLEVVRRLMDHSSFAMTQIYAYIHDTTVRTAWEQARKVNCHGEPVVVDDDSPLADAQWMKHNLGRATMALADGFCGLPLQQSCPHANACHTCPVFITTPEFLPQHRKQLQLTQSLISSARANGRARVVEMNERVESNLQRIIASLDPPTAAEPAGLSRES